MSAALRVKSRGRCGPDDAHRKLILVIRIFTKKLLGSSFSPSFGPRRTRFRKHQILSMTNCGEAYEQGLGATGLEDSPSGARPCRSSSLTSCKPCDARLKRS